MYYNECYTDLIEYLKFESKRDNRHYLNILQTVIGKVMETEADSKFDKFYSFFRNTYGLNISSYNDAINFANDITNKTNNKNDINELRKIIQSLIESINRKLN